MFPTQNAFTPACKQITAQEQFCSSLFQQTLNVDINPIKSFKSIPKPYKVKKSTARFEMLAGNRNMKSCQLQIQLDLYPSQDIDLDDP